MTTRTELFTAVMIVGMGVSSLAWSGFAPEQPDTRAKIVSGTVTKVSDGDTIHVQPATGTKLKVRFNSIDTPELHFPSKTHGVVSQGFWAEKAAAWLEKTIPIGTKVKVKVFGTDRYGRTLGTILVKNEDINLELVREGLAVTYIICEGDDCNSTFMKRHDVETYVAACREAVAKKRGIFSTKPPLAQLPFEFRLTEDEREPDKYVGDLDTGELVEPNQYKTVDVCNRIFFMTKKAAAGVGFER